jgi:type IV pilus assembly protein PilQ
MIETLSQRYEGRKIVNMSSYTGPIGMPITQIYWKNALSLIANYNGLIVEELPGAYVVRDFVAEEKVVEEKPSEEIVPDTKQVRISSIFFTADRSIINSFGIDWSTIYNGNVVASLDFSGGAEVLSEIVSAAITMTLETGEAIIDINALFKTIEHYQKGTIIARPSVTVTSGKQGYLQIGQDFSVRTTDFAGNIVDRFYSAGLILEVTPTVIQDSLKEAIHLVTKVERSDVQPSEVQVIVNKNQATTEVILYDGEETVIAGLYDTEDVVVRKGIPILKDLPWWFLGLRYIFGYERHEQSEREIIIILKAEIIESIGDRMEKRASAKEVIEKSYKPKEHIDSLLFKKKNEKVMTTKD